MSPTRVSLAFTTRLAGSRTLPTSEICMVLTPF
jgi:hypothetical protein